MICPKCEKNSVPFFRFWLTSGFETQICQNCGTICRIKKSPIYLTISFLLALLMVSAAVVGLVLNNWFLAIIPIVAIAVDSFVYRRFRRLDSATSPRRIQTPLLIMLIAGILILISCFVNLSAKNFRSAESYRVDREMQEIAIQLKDKPAGLERLQEFVRRLEAIKTTFAPPDVKQGLNDYIADVEQSIEATKNNQDAKIFDQKISEQWQKLKSTFVKYEQPSVK
jgi:hypothetical protein